MPLRTCAVCTSSANKRCSGCKQVYYCSQQCQSNHWKEHKKECNWPLSKNEFARNGIAHLYLSLVFSIASWQEIFPLIFIATRGVTVKDIQYLFVYAIVRLSVQKSFNNLVIGTPIIASRAVPIALNYKSQQPYSNPSIASFRSLYFVYNFVIVAAVWIQLIYLDWMWPDSTSDKESLSSMTRKRLHGIIVMFVFGIMYICNCVVFFFKYVRVSSINQSTNQSINQSAIWPSQSHSFPLCCGLIGLFALLFGVLWLFGVDYNLFLYCLWELNSKEYILCSTMLSVYVSFVYFFGDNFWIINMFSWVKRLESGKIEGVLGVVIGTMIAQTGWSYFMYDTWDTALYIMYIMYALYIMYRTWETRTYVQKCMGLVNC